MGFKQGGWLGLQVLALVQECWEQEPRARPTMEAVCARMEGILGDVRARLRRERPR